MALAKQSGDPNVSRANLRSRVSFGIVAQGQIAIGIVAIGGVAIGVVAVGGIAIGLVAIGGVSAGGIALGGLAAGWKAIGAFAFGLGSAQGAVKSFVAAANLIFAGLPRKLAVLRHVPGSRVRRTLPWWRSG